jgi:hypothetical protein
VNPNREIKALSGAVGLVALLLFGLWNITALAGCALLGPENDDVEPDTSFFPLEVGTTWIFAREDLSRRTSLPDTFRTTVVSSRLIDGEKYFMVEGFYMPARIDPFVTVEVRRDHCCIFLRLDGVEHLMYDFAGADSTWDVPLSDVSTTGDFVVVRRESGTNRVLFNWDDAPGRSEVNYDEVLTRGIGRTQIIYYSWFGTHEWNLVATANQE